MLDAAVAVALADHGVDALGRHSAAGGGAEVGGGEDDAGAGDALELAGHAGQLAGLVGAVHAVRPPVRGPLARDAAPVARRERRRAAAKKSVTRSMIM